MAEMLPGEPCALRKGRPSHRSDLIHDPYLGRRPRAGAALAWRSVGALVRLDRAAVAIIEANNVVQLRC
jgi:hypothetical protein